MIDTLQKDKVIVMIFATLVTGAISEGPPEKEILLGKLHFEKSRKMTVSHNYGTEYSIISIARKEIKIYLVKMSYSKVNDF